MKPNSGVALGKGGDGSTTRGRSMTEPDKRKLFCKIGRSGNAGLLGEGKNTNFKGGERVVSANVRRGPPSKQKTTIATGRGNWGRQTSYSQRPGEHQREALEMCQSMEEGEIYNTLSDRDAQYQGWLRIEVDNKSLPCQARLLPSIVVRSLAFANLRKLVL